MPGEPGPYNPLAESNLARQVADAIERQPLRALMPDRFYGSGLYALYYHGDFGLYRPITNSAIPIYVGKAAARSTRIGAVDSGTAKLWGRIAKHARSLDQADNLTAADFFCRYLVTSDVWIVLGEQGLLAEYGPLWNVTLDGFGNNDPGRGRYDQAVSSWDTLHPGRPWVQNLTQPNPLSHAEIEAKVRRALEDRAAGEPVPEHILASDPMDVDAEEGDHPPDLA